MSLGRYARRALHSGQSAQSAMSKECFVICFFPLSRESEDGALEMKRSLGSQLFRNGQILASLALAVSGMVLGTASGQELPLSKFVIGDPPRASARFPLPADSKLTLNKGRLVDVAKNLSQTLSSNGYVELGWFRVSHDGHALDGFAVVTRLERIDKDGKSIPNERFSQEPFTTPVTSWADYFSGLLVHAPSGHYRLFMFYILQNSSVSPRQTAPPTVDSLNSLFVSGSRTLPTLPTDVNFNPPFTCISYVYLWDRLSANDSPTFVENAGMDGKSQLIAAGLWNGLGTP